MKSKYLEFGIEELELPVQSICDIIGFSGPEELNLLQGLVTESLRDIEDECSIRAQYYVYEELEMDSRSGTLGIERTQFKPGKLILGQLKKSESLAVFLCTAGKEIGNMSRKAMSEKDLLRGFILDVIGSEIVEAATDKMQEDIEKSSADHGYKITNRYSPGYCGWDVNEQKLLFRMIPGNSCGITLNESSLMDPVKSVSGIIGIGKNVKKIPYTCNICNFQNCIYRKKSRSDDL